MGWHPIQGGEGVEILLVTSCYRNWNKGWPDGLLGTICRLDFHRLSCHFAEQVLVQNISHENHLIFMRMTVQVAYIFILIVHTKTRFATEAKVNLGLGYSSMSCSGSL